MGAQLHGRGRDAEHLRRFGDRQSLLSAARTRSRVSAGAPARAGRAHELPLLDRAVVVARHLGEVRRQRIGRSASGGARPPARRVDHEPARVAKAHGITAAPREVPRDRWMWRKVSARVAAEIGVVDVARRYAKRRPRRRRRPARTSRRRRPRTVPSPRRRNHRLFALRRRRHSASADIAAGLPVRPHCPAGACRKQAAFRATSGRRKFLEKERNSSSPGGSGGKWFIEGGPAGRAAVLRAAIRRHDGSSNFSPAHGRRSAACLGTRSFTHPRAEPSPDATATMRNDENDGVRHCYRMVSARVHSGPDRRVRRAAATAQGPLGRRGRLSRLRRPGSSPDVAPAPAVECDLRREARSGCLERREVRRRL